MLRTRCRRTLPKYVGLQYDPLLPLVFMHIPKTSGVALTAALRGAIKPQREINGFDRSHFGAFRGFDSFAPDAGIRVYTGPDDIPEDGDFIAGHIAFSTLRQRYKSANYVTVLREPTSRLISNWLYGRTIPDSTLAKLGAWADHVRQARKSLKDFLSCKRLACTTDNLSVRMLLWPHRLIPEADFIESRDYDVILNEAIEAIRQFSFADVLENPDMQINIEAWLGRRLQYDVINDTHRVPPPLRTQLHNELTRESLEMVNNLNRVDLALWTWLANERIGTDVDVLRWSSVIRNTARHAALSTSFEPSTLSSSSTCCTDHEQGERPGVAQPFTRGASMLEIVDSPPSLDLPVSQACTQSQFDDGAYAFWCTRIRETPRYHRKQWEFCYILQVLATRAMIAPGRVGLGFGVGTEPISAVLAHGGCRLVATDMEPSEAERKG